MNTTIDGLLDRRVTLEQPAEGYRVAVDTVLLAAAVPAVAGQKALELGCGVGGAMLCMACRVPGIAITGIEIQDELTRLCEANIARNKFADLEIRRADATNLPPDLASIFDHVFMNPPYHEAARHDVSAQAQKRTANAENAGDLGRWIAAAAKALKPSGFLTLIHRADRLDEILALLPPAFGAIEIVPILPKAEAPPKRIVLRARKDAPAGMAHCHNFVLHQADGGYTDEAEAILRHMKVLPFRQ